MAGQDYVVGANRGLCRFKQQQLLCGRWPRAETNVMFWAPTALSQVSAYSKNDSEFFSVVCSATSAFKKASQVPRING